MALRTCWRCLQPHQRSFLPHTNSPTLPSLLLLLLRPFTTTPPLPRDSLKAGQKGRNAAKTGPKRGERKTFRKTNKSKSDSLKGRPEPGARKAARKRIVLSNTNALEVPDIRDLSLEEKGEGAAPLDSVRGQVVGIADALVDRLRAAEAFQPTQGWSMFRKPCTLVRRETVEYARLMAGEGGDVPLGEGGGGSGSDGESATAKVTRKVLVGERGSGKSILVLQVMMMAFLKEWVVIHIPDAMELANGHTEYAPLPDTTPTLYQQPAYLSALLHRIALANPILATLRLSAPPPPPSSFPIPLNPTLSLRDLCALAENDASLAQPAFGLLLAELTAPGTAAHPRPPLCLTLDNLAHVMKPTAYRSPAYAPIHAHDLHLAAWFLAHLTGSARLPNGGVVLAAMNACNTPALPALSLGLARLEARQDPARRDPTPAMIEAATTRSPVAAFLRSTETPPTLIPTRDGHVRYDERVLEVFERGFAEGGLGVQRLEALGREEARALMEYWGRSGVVREVVGARVVGEKWSLSGGNVGELERCAFRERVEA